MINRGFFTIATGDEKYYKFANNLLQSYRLRNDKYPFAILCDRENKYTKDFDQVVILNDVKYSYLDKFKMLIDTPYEEGIFIEPDCLIYRDISVFFDMLAKESDLSSFGWNDDKITHWFDNPRKIIEKYGNVLEEIPLFCPGYMFIRKSETCNKIYYDLLELSEWIMKNAIDENPRLLCGNSLRDDPLFFLAMKLNGCICVEKPSIGKCINFPKTKKILRISMRKGQLDVVQDRVFCDCNLLHFSTRRCVEEGLYLHQCISIALITNKTPSFLIDVFDFCVFIAVFQLVRRIKYTIAHRYNKNRIGIFKYLVAVMK